MSHSIDLIFYPTFPEPKDVRRVVMRRLPSQTRLTLPGILAVLRHDFTNYDALLHRHPHDILKPFVNNAILDRIGEEWKKPVTQEEWNAECAYEEPCLQCIHPTCKNYCRRVDATQILPGNENVA